MSETLPDEATATMPDRGSPDRKWEIWVVLFVVFGCIATVAYTFGEVFWG